MGPGNVSPVTQVTGGIDRTVPSVTASLDAASRSVSITGVDSGSGVAAVQYRLTVGGVVTQDWTTAGGPVPIGSIAGMPVSPLVTLTPKTSPFLATWLIISPKPSVTSAR